MSELITLPKSVWSLKIAGKDISADVSPWVLGVEYEDNLHGKSDQLTVRFADPDGRWREHWWPEKGDVLRFSFGLEHGAWQDAGSFELDETEYAWERSSGGVLTTKGQSAAITGDLRTPRNRAFEGQSLKELVGGVAIKHGFDVVGDVPDVSFDRVTQSGESDLAFVTRMADEYGAAVAIKDNKMVFTDRFALRDGATAAVITPADALSINLKDRTAKTAGSAEVSYNDPATGKLVSVTVEDPKATSGDVHKITDRVENELQARARAKAALARINGGAKGGMVRLPVRPDIAAGSTVVLSGFGKGDGAYTVERARHSIDQSGGGTSELELKGA